MLFSIRIWTLGLAALTGLIGLGIALEGIWADRVHERRAHEYVERMAVWVKSMKREAPKEPSPWGGGYRYAAKIPVHNRPALCVDGFPPFARVHFELEDKVALQRVWAEHSIAGTRLVFLLGDWPAILLEP